MENIRVRLAPSPTGEDLHIGNAYTALLNCIFAKKHNGAFIVRLEDTDRTRFVPNAEKKILSSLRFLNLLYDEGPDIPGAYGPYRQSERLEIYRKYVQKLIENGSAYYCTCSPQRLEDMRKKQKEAGMPPMYDGTCKRTRSAAPPTETPYVIRLNVPDEKTTTIRDEIRGDITFENHTIDDQILIKSDGFPTYHFAVVVDDHLMKISHIIRGEDWISSTPKHVLLYNAFGWKLPVFAHVPLLRNPDRTKLSKRKNPVWVSWYRERGFLPEAICNFLALMGWSKKPSAEDQTNQAEMEIFSREEMMRHFELSDIKPVGPVFDVRKLEWMNGEYIRRSENAELKKKINEFLERKYAEEIIGETIPLVKDRMKTLADYLPLCAFFFNPPEQYERELSGQIQHLNAVYEQLSSLSHWSGEKIGETLQMYASQSGWKKGEFFMLIRVAITGKKISPPLNESMESLGKEKTLQYLRNAMRKNT